MVPIFAVVFRRRPSMTSNLSNRCYTEEMTRRYVRQTTFPPIGTHGQEMIANAKVVVVGCGALGSCSAEMLVRAGVEKLTLVDRDLVDISNLQRQCLFTEEDALKGTPKAVAAKRALLRINSTSHIEAKVLAVDSHNVESAIGIPDLIIDGSDNFPLRFLINEYAVKNTIPWIYGACLSSRGLVITFLPEAGFCLRCLMGSLPKPGSLETCASSGIIAPAVHIVSASQVAMALSVLTKQRPEKLLFEFDVWKGSFRTSQVSSAKLLPCQVCEEHKFEDLEHSHTPRVERLCGAGTIQLVPPQETEIDYQKIKDRLDGSVEISENQYMLRLSLSDCDITLFRDGRSIIRGVSDSLSAQNLYATYIGY